MMKKEIIVKESNKEAITAAIKEAEGRATVRTITYEKIAMACKTIENQLGIPKKYMKDVSAYVDINAQDFPNAYRFIPQSTQFRVYYTGKDWKLTSIYRDKTERLNGMFRLNLTPDAEKAILAQYRVFSRGLIRLELC